MESNLRDLDFEMGEEEKKTQDMKIKMREIERDIETVTDEIGLLHQAEVDLEIELKLEDDKIKDSHME